MDHAQLGDPDGMERLASTLLLRAESIAGIADSLDRQVEAMTLVGPAGDQVRSDMDARRRRAHRVAQELQEMAHTLRRNAASVREQLYELQLAEARRREQDS